MQGGGNSGGGGGGGAERSRNGLARFRSAPVTWLEALLEDEEQEQEEDDEEEDDPLKHNQCFTQLLTGNAPKPTNAAAATPGRSAAPFLGASDDPALFGLGPSPGFLGRQNSSPANFLGGGYFGARGGDFERASSNSVEVSPSGKRAREATPVRITPAKYGSHMKREQGSDEGFLDMEMEKLFEDSGSVPCRFRAKRGCATHPRSIAERVRRTRISDRIRKLQELMPNMDKQTNTADMLDEAVEYVKFLQKQIQELREYQKNCKCMSKE